MKGTTLLVMLGLLCLGVMAQTDSSLAAASFSKLSLEELMDIPIYSVSKSNESSFDAPLSSWVVTREEIRKAGCTSIMEALRLVPGVIVREQSNGNYDIHIRGLDGVPPNLGMYFFTNSTTLVMIDDRPVYNYLHGGTFWETLPVDINDVEKIEVVSGPSAAMYGPNAESGVINIITRRPEKKGVYAVANAQYGRFNTGIANASVGYKFNDKISAVVSGNFQNRERTQTGYYDVVSNKFLALDSFVPNDSLRALRYPHPKLAMRKFGFNGSVNYQINDHASISVQGGGQNSEVQNQFAVSYLTTAKSASYYVNFKAELYGLNVQYSYLNGTQSPQVGVTPWKWNFNTTDIVIDYKINQVKNLTITPGMSYRRATYDDRKFVREELMEGFFNRKVTAYSLAAFLRADYTAFKNKLRLAAAARLDKFFYGPKKPYVSWQFMATYKATPQHLLRIVQSRAYRSPLFIDNFLDQASNFNVPQLGAGTVQLVGNSDLKLLTTDMLEFGYRGKLKDNLTIDLVIFGSQTKNFSNIVYDHSVIDTAGLNTNVIFKFQNLPLMARQIGGTLSFNFVAGKFQIKPYVTIQHTTLFNYSPYAVSATADSVYFIPNSTTNNINSGLGTQMKSQSTPAVYGGAYIDVQITPQLNLNLNPYFLAGHTQLEASNLTYNDGVRGVQKLSPKFIMNVVVSYTFFKKLTLFMNFKNCFSDKSREFFRGDTPGFKVLGGVNFEF
jgi:iron complex outermembrane receptor protein